MNLLNDAWIPVRRKSGAVERIAPWEVTTDYATDPMVALAAPRPDFNGALIQFLIGLLQTTCAPASERAWHAWRRDPPTPDTLRTACQGIAFAFELDGDEARFMQDTALKLGSGKDAVPISALLIDTPGENAVQRNTDHFTKRGGIGQLCAACTATALFALQTNAPSGGQGHRTSLRGGGPLTTLLLGDTLWQTAWLNVLEQRTFLAHHTAHEHETPQQHFPWLGPTRTSEKGSPTEKTTPLDVHPDQYFWAMPRRLWLLPERATSPAACDVCGDTTTTRYCRYVTKNYGVNYEGPWLHPLSPYYLDKTDKTTPPNPVHPQPGGIGYRHWLGCIENTADNLRRIAQVVEQHHRLLREDGRLWAFGYHVDKGKICCWYDAEMPIIFVAEEISVEYKAYIENSIAAADQVVKDLRQAVRNALFRRPADVRGDFSHLDGRFWSATEPAFYDLLYRLRDALQAGADITPLHQEWYATLRSTARRIFDDVSQTGDFNAADPRRIARAWNNLNKALAGKKLRDLLMLAA